ncbi:hypothetical protein E2C01_030074 [Portunus trituberculatus]|uniref:Uncharacterized protein n=1 Tax=Portunus trituberculatus TaxID=210409 RepID=A0A5B7EPJ1_PORTR|nr:hypothetical protein [Portunus trituberculatus]
MSKISAKSGGSLSLDQLERNQLRSTEVLTHIEHDLHLCAGDVRAIAEGEGVVQGADHPTHMRQPHLQEANLDQNELVILGQLREPCVGRER